jgi:hypothetical protein
MRKFFAGTPAAVAAAAALESIAEKPIISLEEEALIIDETNEVSTDVANELTEAERIVEVSDALEDLAVIADGIEEATPAEIALIETTGNMAVAGTDVSPEEVVPTLVPEPTPVLNEDGTPRVDDAGVAVVAQESYVGKRISAESIQGIRETAKKIWQNIQAFLVKIWDQIVAFFNKIFDTIPRLKNTLEEMKVAIKEAEGKKAGDKVTITNGVTALSVNYKPANNEAALSAGIKNLEDVAKFVFTTYVDNTVARGDAIAKAIESFDATKSGEAVTSLRDALAKTKSSDIPKKTQGEKNRFNGFNTSYSTPLLGNVSLAEKEYIDSNKTTALGALDRFRGSTIELISTSQSSASSVSSFVMAPLSTSAMTKLIDGALSLLGTVEAYDKGPKSKAIAEAKKKIEAASSKAEKDMAKLSGDEGNATVVADYRALLNFNLAFARWAQTPTIPVVKHTLGEVRAIAFVVQKSLSGYKAEEAAPAAAAATA